MKLTKDAVRAFLDRRDVLVGQEHILQDQIAALRDEQRVLEQNFKQAHNLSPGSWVDFVIRDWLWREMRNGEPNVTS